MLCWDRPVLCGCVGYGRERGLADTVDFGCQAVEYPHRRFQILLRSTIGPIDVYLVRFVVFLSCTAGSVGVVRNGSGLVHVERLR